MQINQKKKLAAGFSIISNILITTLKITAGIISGSISIISEALHSLSDFFASILTYYSVKKSSKPADFDHPFGHGRYEDMAGFIEGFLIIFASFIITFTSVKKIMTGNLTEPQSSIGIAVMVAAVILNFLVSSYLFKVAKESNSVSLYADGEHLRTDVYSSLGVLAGLILIKITGYIILDSVIAILISIFIYNTGYKIVQKSLLHLLDFSLPDEEIKRIKNIISSTSDLVVLKENSIRARQSGPIKDMDLILMFPKNTSLCECHKICDEIEKQIGLIYKNSSISIHFEPICYNKNCNNLCKCDKTSMVAEKI
ncbi:MAG: cation transporter [Candidatus Gastranaerophilales bacterium]|nr:cation transporter [Candidatus Gastranaerophilales bacterium]